MFRSGRSPNPVGVAIGLAIAFVLAVFTLYAFTGLPLR